MPGVVQPAASRRPWHTRLYSTAGLPGAVDPGGPTWRHVQCPAPCRPAAPNMRCACVCTPALLPRAVQDAGIKTADAVVLGSHDKLPPVEADALTLANMLQVRVLTCCVWPHVPDVCACLFGRPAWGGLVNMLLQVGVGFGGGRGTCGGRPARPRTAAAHAPAPILPVLLALPGRPAGAGRGDRVRAHQGPAPGGQGQPQLHHAGERLARLRRRACAVGI
jgi:hypothetical protein